MPKVSETGCAFEGTGPVALDRFKVSRHSPNAEPGLEPATP
jgi:hypothetical protein